MITPEEHPRVRPSLWAAIFLLGGICLLYLGHNQEWFFSALFTGRLHNLTYFLAWGIVSAAYSILAAYLWSRLARQAGVIRVFLASLAFVALMVAGSQVAARRVMERAALMIDSVTWDPVSQEFVVRTMSTPAIAAAHQRGDVEALVSVEGFLLTQSKVRSGGGYVEGYEIIAGSPDLAGHRGGALPIDLDYHNLVGFGDLRVPWGSRSEEGGSVHLRWVNVALVDRKGKRIGVMSSVYWYRDSAVIELDTLDPR